MQGQADHAFGRLRELFSRLSELDTAERNAALQALLEHADRADSPLDAPALRRPEPLPERPERLSEDPTPLPRVDGYRIEQRIGRGGSATAHLAEQERDEFCRKGALKVVDRVLDPHALRRVREEQRILASLEHPGIARLYAP